jgi:hypothetical protein
MPGPPLATPLIIRHVTQALIKLIDERVSVPVKALPPDRVTAEGQVVGVYLYRVVESPELKNQGPIYEPGPSVPASEAQQILVRTDPLALNLHYLVIPFSEVSGSFLDTYNLLGETMLALHENGTFTPGVLDVGVDSTEIDFQYRVTMEPLTISELAAIWEAVNEPYRLSVSYVVRTIQIKSGDTQTTRRVTVRNAEVGQEPEGGLPPP